MRSSAGRLQQLSLSWSVSSRGIVHQREVQPAFQHNSKNAQVRVGMVLRRMDALTI